MTVTRTERVVEETDVVDGGVYLELLGEDPPAGMTVSLFEVDSEKDVEASVASLTQSFHDFEQASPPHGRQSGVVTVIRMKDKPLLIGVAASYGGLGEILKQ